MVLGHPPARQDEPGPGVRASLGECRRGVHGGEDHRVRVPHLADVPEVFHVNIKSGARIQPTTGGGAVNQATPFAVNLTMNLWTRKDFRCEERVSGDCLQTHTLKTKSPGFVLA